MNILREVRRVRQKSMPVRIILLLAFCVIFIVTTYAWFASDKDISLGGLEGSVTSWDVSYYVNEDEDETLDRVAILTVDEFYPGMPNREDVIHIYNVGTSSTNIAYELISIKVFGQEVLDTLRTSGEITTSGNTTNLFSKDTQYPFNISYTFDKTYLNGKYEDDATTPNAVATFKYNVSWTYEGNGSAEDNLARDVLDTKFGKDAYAYYQNEANDPTKAVEVQVRITSTMIHPSLEAGSN